MTKMPRKDTRDCGNATTFSSSHSKNDSESTNRKNGLRSSRGKNSSVVVITAAAAITLISVDLITRYFT